MSESTKEDINNNFPYTCKYFAVKCIESLGLDSSGEMFSVVDNVLPEAGILVNTINHVEFLSFTF